RVAGPRGPLHRPRWPCPAGVGAAAADRQPDSRAGGSRDYNGRSTGMNGPTFIRFGTAYYSVEGVHTVEELPDGTVEITYSGGRGKLCLQGENAAAALDWVRGLCHRMEPLFCPKGPLVTK